MYLMRMLLTTIAAAWTSLAGACSLIAEILVDGKLMVGPSENQEVIRLARRRALQLAGTHSGGVGILPILILATLVRLACATSSALPSQTANSANSSFITPDFRLHESDYSLSRRGFDIDSDSLGNFYVSWVQGIQNEVGPDGMMVVIRIRSDGSLDEPFIVLDAILNGDTTQGFERPTRIDVAKHGNLIAIQYVRDFDQPYPKGIGTTGQVLLPEYRHSFVTLFDSTAAPISQEIWLDSIQPGIQARTIGVHLSSQGFVAAWRADSNFITGGAYLQAFDWAGNRNGGYSRVDTCINFTCLGGQSKRRDSWHGGFIITWDEVVSELGEGEYRPLFRIYDSLGQPLSQVIAGAYESSYVADCGGSAPGYQSGYFPDVACADNGEFMIVWASCDGLDFDPFGAKPWGQIYNADGTPKTGLILLADTPNHDGIDIKVAWGDDGNYYAAWADSRYSCATCIAPLDVFVQKISPDGNLIGSNYVVNDVRQKVANGYDVDIAVSRGRACIIWRDIRQYPIPDEDGEFYGQIVSVDLIGNYLHGDVNLDYAFTSADVIYLVNYVFKSGQAPMAGPQYGEVTGDCVTTAADIIHYVNFVFKGGEALRDACSN